MAHLNRWLCFLCCLTALFGPLDCRADSRLNRSGYIAISIDPILYQSSLWETTHRISLDQFFTEQSEELGNALAAGLEKTTFSLPVRVVAGYHADEQTDFRETGVPETFLLTVDIRSLYGLTESSSAATCLSGISFLALSPVNMFTYESKTEATVTAFYFTRDGKRQRLLQERYQSRGEVSGDFYDAMDMAQEFEWITHLTRGAIDDIRRQILAELPTELISRSRNTAAENFQSPPAAGTDQPSADAPGKTKTIKRFSLGVKTTRTKELDRQKLSLQQLTQVVTPAIFKVQTERGSGSGFTISSRGFLVTSLHVVKEAQKILVLGQDGKQRPARIVKTQPELDLVILSFEGDEMNTLPIGDSNKITVGDPVVTFGYPLDEGLSITPARISSLDEYRGLPLLLIDTLVPAGNSGGPLVNSYGEAVGITFRKKERLHNEGTTLAIPINQAWKIFDEFLDSDNK